MSKIVNTFEKNMPDICTRFRTYLENRKKSTKGRKRKTSMEAFLKAVFGVARYGVSTTALKELYGIPKATYFHYFKLFQQSGILRELMDQTKNKLSDILIGDTFTVKSHDGSDSVGANPTDRGRKGIKVQVISDISGIISSVCSEPANKHDSKIFIKHLRNYDQHKIMLLDSAYVGKPVQEHAVKNNIRPVVVPKKLCNGKQSHVLDSQDLVLIKKRWTIERIIGVLRRFKGVSNKFTKTISGYQCYLLLAVTLINSYITGIVGSL